MLGGSITFLCLLLLPALAGVARRERLQLAAALNFPRVRGGERSLFCPILRISWQSLKFPAGPMVRC
ncbi:GlyGly-CTERM sorting domain-containing protein [Streptomyces cavourensis]|uniref:GlyGly-CTERM sorting domain-containing protein n=1 Tax=Streptomyces cavourensis TaxID=67258 RepID=A0AAD0VEE9_9ACTN|nr:GlyGly-CTERM sorting domain-containing protein [Streptomyces cavourensis]